MDTVICYNRVNATVVELVDTRDSKSLFRKKVGSSPISGIKEKYMNYKYKVYGLGNSLLDYEYLVQDSMLDELEIKKGTMLLNEFDKHQEIHKFIKDNAEIQKIVQEDLLQILSTRCRNLIAMFVLLAKFQMIKQVKRLLNH